MHVSGGAAGKDKLCRDLKHVFHVIDLVNARWYREIAWQRVRGVDRDAAVESWRAVTGPGATDVTASGRLVRGV